MPQSNFYNVYLTFRYKDGDGNLTSDYTLAKLLYRKLELRGIHAFMMGKSSPDDRTEAIDSAVVLVVVGMSEDALLTDEVRKDYEDFTAGVELTDKSVWRIFTYLRSMAPDGLPAYLQKHRSYGFHDIDRLVDKIEYTINKKEPKSCVSDAEEPRREECLEESAEEASAYLPECLPDSAESVREYEDDDEDDMPLPRRGRARRAPQRYSEEMRAEEAPQPEPPTETNSVGQNAAPVIPPVPPMPPAPSLPSSPKKVKPEKIKPRKVTPAKVNKVDFSVVAPDEVKPGKSALIDLLMYTKSQRSIVRKTIEQAKEKSSEAARSAGSVSVKQGSQVTAELFSDDIQITDGSRTMIWNGDALDFKFRVTPPEDYAKKEIDFGCVVRFDGIEITRLYFTVPVGAKKKAAVRFVRKDCRRAFVSYSHKDKLRVVEQLLAIQAVAPKLRFWMDNRSMTAGDEWRKAIASAISGADVFLLFWSASAKASSEVRKEWEYALKLEQGRKRGRNGMRFISPVPLDNPSECPPPEELGDLHFGDPSFDSDIDDIEKVQVWAVRGKNIKYL